MLSLLTFKTTNAIHARDVPVSAFYLIDIVSRQGGGGERARRRWLPLIRERAVGLKAVVLVVGATERKW